MIQLINKENLKLSFKTDMNISLANAIRRSVNKIPILAVDSLEISKNDSALYDEIVSHRVGLIPLKNEKLKPAAECDCGKEEGCSKCSLKLKLSATGPGMIYAEKLNPKDSVVYPGIPITFLNKEQELEFVATAKVGVGADHAKFSPGLLYYYFEGDNPKDNDENFRKLVEETKKDKSKPLIINIEAWGQISPKEIFNDSIKVINEELKDLLKSLK